VRPGISKEDGPWGALAETINLDRARLPVGGGSGEAIALGW
jgi:hypothetical protein